MLGDSGCEGTSTHSPVSAVSAVSSVLLSPSTEPNVVTPGVNISGVNISEGLGVVVDDVVAEVVRAVVLTVERLEL